MLGVSSESTFITIAYSEQVVAAVTKPRERLHLLFASLDTR